MVDPILAEFEALVARVGLKPPAIPFLSNVTGTWITEAEATSPAYWVQHLRQAVRFSDGLAELLADPEMALLEVGPGQTLTALARQNPHKGEGRLILASGRHVREQAGDLAALLGALGRLWLAGVTVDWTGFWAGERRRRVALPTYPFERQRYWVEAPRWSGVEPAALYAGEMVAAATAETGTAAATAAAEPAADYQEPDGEIERAVADIWQEVLGLARVGRLDNFFALGGDSLVASRVLTRLREAFPVEVPLSAIFEAPTVEGLAARVEALLIEKLESMSGDEAAGLL
jgi:acyl transferase domain-containing protein